MKLTHYIYISTALALYSACSDDIEPASNMVGEGNNAIVLTAGIVDGTQAKTRADGDTPNLHVPFSSTTQLRLHIEGDWTGKEPTLQQYNAVCSTQDATIKLDGAAADPNDKHPLTALSPMIYWDNYGTADPANTTNRAKGLTVLGVAVDKEITAPPVADDKWKGGFAWEVKTDGTDVLKKDLLVTNNFKAGLDGESNATGLAFDTRDTKNLLEFKHVLSKITINLTAGLGFPTEAPTGKTYVGNTNYKFEQEPIFTLTSNKEGESNDEYALTSGTVDISTGVVTTEESSNKTVIAQTTEYPSNVTVRKEALVFPGTLFAADATIGKVEVDKNVFYITSGKIRDAISAKEGGTPDYKTKSGYNYILNIIVKKTGIVVTATIRDWDPVNAVEETPKINIDKTYGHTGIAFTESFDFFRSTTKASGYSNDAYVEYSGGSYVFHNPLYWPDHQTHYFFRGVFPRVQTGENVSGEEKWIPAGKVSASTAPASTIAVENVAYSSGTYPSDLAFGWPRTTNDEGDDETCKVHSGTQGICATEGNINMNFKYVMSKVQVSLKSSGTEGKDKVDLSDVEVQIINGYNSGKIQLSDGKHATFADTDKAVSYPLHPLTTPETGFTVTSLDAIVPQDIANDVKIRIIVKDNTDAHNILDVYEAQLNQIEDSSSNPVNVWEPGKWYKYQLDIKKTEIKVKATITDWKTVNAGGSVWF